MVFPQTVLPMHIDLYLNGWTDITTDPVRRAGVNITRGRSDEAGQVDRSTCTMEIDNRSGKYSPRNPTSPYYGILGRNTPVRVSIERPTCALRLDGTAGGRITTPDVAALDITGDIDVRIELKLWHWRKGYDLVGKYTTTGNQRSWALYLHADGSGRLSWTWSTNGTATLTAISTVPVPAPASGKQALRVTLDVDNGASGNTVTFYYSDTIAGTWTQLGDPVITASTTSIFNSTAIVELGDIASLTNTVPSGEIYKLQILNGIGGSAAADPDFTIQTHGASSFADAAGRTWTVQAGAEISNRDYRFHGEVSSWPQRWDSTGRDITTPIEAAGVMQRLGQGGAVEGSVMYRALLRNTSGLVAYWPFEDVEGATMAAPALSHQGMRITGTPTFAAFDGFVASSPIMTLNGASFTGAAPKYTVGNFTQVRWLMNVPAAGAEDNQVVLMWYTTGSVRRWEVHYGTGGTLGLRAFDGGGTQLFDTGDVAFAVNGELLLVSVELTQSGSNINYTLSTLEPAASSGLTTSGTLNSNTVGQVGYITVSPGGGIASISIGHLSVQNVVTSLFELGAQLAGWAGETAGRRVERLCREENVTFKCIGDIDDTVRMGVQRPQALLTLLRECADADMGMLYEPRDTLGLGYRTRMSLCNQTARVSFAYSAAVLSEAPDPTDDDQQTQNDVTASRDNGSSARAVQESGPLSVQQPPNGVGRYAVSESVNVQYDAQLFDQASWRLFLGTINEARYPKISINLARSQVAGNASLTAAIRSVEAGDRFVITNTPSWIPPENISQIVQGYAEQLNNFEHDIVFNCSPESPYQSAALYWNNSDSDPDRYQPEDSALAGTMTTSATSVTVSTTTGPLWTTDAGEFPFDIMVGGERMTVTNISGSSSPQTFTVTRSVNGVVKTHAIGELVEMFMKSVYGM